LLQRVSVFSGGWTLEAAEAVSSDETIIPKEKVLDLFSQLINKSLVLMDWQMDGEARYTMLPTIREFGREKLRASGDLERMHSSHFEYFLDFAGRAEVIGSQKSIWLDRLEAEQDNFRAALAWSWETESAERVNQAAHLLGLLADYFFYRGYLTEALEWFDRLLSFELPSSRGIALGFQKAGFLFRVRGNFDKAVYLLKRSLEISREIGDNARAGWALLDLANAARDMGNAEEVIPCISEALSLFQELADKRGILNSYYLFAGTYMHRRDMNQAKFFWGQGLELSRQMNDKSFIAWGLEGLAASAFVERQIEQAKSLHLESLKYKVEVMDKAGMAYSFEGLAQVASLKAEPERAAILWGAAEGLRTLLNMPLDPSRQDFYISLIPTVREQIGDPAFDQAWKMGKAMTLNETIEFALTIRDP
jgi:non-specific serine/threonine protein kinase